MSFAEFEQVQFFNIHLTLELYPANRWFVNHFRSDIFTKIYIKYHISTVKYQINQDFRENRSAFGKIKTEFKKYDKNIQ